MRITRFILLASVFLMAVPAAGGSHESELPRMEISVSVIVENCSRLEYYYPSIEGNIVAWTRYDYRTDGSDYVETINVAWMDLEEGVVHDIYVDRYTFQPSVSSGRIAFSGSNGSAYVLYTNNGSIEKVREGWAHSYRLEGDVLYSRNSSNAGVDIFYLGNRTLRTIGLRSNDIDLSGNSLCYITSNEREIGVIDIATGQKRSIWQGIGNPNDVYISGQRLLWRFYRDDYSQDRLVLFDPEHGLKNITDPEQMRVGSIALSEKYIAWAGRWMVENVSGNLFVYDIGSGIYQEIFANATWEDAPVIDGNRIVFYRNRDGSCDLMMAEVISTPGKAQAAPERRSIGSVQAPVFALDLALLVVCLCLWLLPERGPRRGSPLPRTVSGPAAGRGSSSGPSRDPRLRSFALRPPR